MPMDTTEKIAALRAMMVEHQIDAYIVPGTDPHASEYMAPHWEEMNWLSGFRGESGTLVVTADDARLWTDSRYYLQADIELRDSGISLMRESDLDCPSVTDWLISLAPRWMEKRPEWSFRRDEGAEGGKGAFCVGINPEMFSVDSYKAMRERFAEVGLKLCSIDLIAPVWTTDRPAIPSAPLYAYDAAFAGESVADKLARIRQRLAEKHATAMVISALDEIAWLLNIRGCDVAYNPVVISYCVLELNRCTLFVNPDKVDAAAAHYFAENDITVRPYEDVFAYLGELSGAVLLDGSKVNERLLESLNQQSSILNPQSSIINAPSPIQADKSHKNPIELDGERRAMLQDSVALTRFFRWLELEGHEGRTEWELMEKLHEFRALGTNFVTESFETIAGWRANGAIVHYAAKPDSCATLHGDGVLLLDSGGQYLDGTTDITRTVWLGNPDHIPAQAKRDYTYVLKGHLALGHIQWPRGTRGNQLDALAKQYMWQAGITFGHGTGHGVGHFLGCHEGPQSIRKDMNPNALEPGQICSNEPGIYRTGEWGIRIENLVACEPAPRTDACTTDDEFLRWETLTLCYYDTSLIDFSLLTPQEIEWLNRYHERVYALTAPLLTDVEAEWLRTKCALIPIS